MANKYDILFSVQCDHEFFNRSHLNISFKPTRETEIILQDLKASYSLNKNVLYVFIQSHADKPIIQIPEGICFRFYLDIEERRFNNITGGIQLLADNCLYFSNHQCKEVDSKLFISAPVLKYSKLTSYEQGDLAANNVGAVYEALRYNPEGDATSKPLSDTIYWKKLDVTKAYASITDLIQTSGDTFSTAIDPASSHISIAVKRLNLQSKLFDIDALPIQDTIRPEAISEVSVGLDVLEDGLYKLIINGVEHIVYKDTTLLKSGHSGVVEIYHHPQLLEAGRLLDNTGALVQPHYNVNFKSRSILWRYITKTVDNTLSVADASDNSLVFIPEGDRSFLSEKLIQLQEKVSRNIVLKKNNAIRLNNLQTPTGQSLRSVKKDDGTLLVSEVFINF